MQLLAPVLAKQRCPARSRALVQAKKQLQMRLLAPIVFKKAAVEAAVEAAACVGMTPSMALGSIDNDGMDG